MRYILKPLNAILDTCFAWFTPGWRRRGHDAFSFLKRYINYYRPSLAPEKAEKLSAIRDSLKESLLRWNKEETTRLAKQVQEAGENLPGYKRHALVELAESFFVVMVIFLGIRTYYAQPFRIPTGSMQPTLNGITITPLSEEEASPSLPERCWNMVVRGSSYVNIIIDKPKKIIDLKTDQYWLIFTRTKVYFDDGSVQYLPCASGAAAEYLEQTGKLRRTLQPGETLIRARMDAGDMVLVNRMAYHFRRPERGETFVFDTRGINTDIPAAMPDQSKAHHFIKRLCGLPGDTLEIEAPRLLVNGSPAAEKTIARVAAGLPPYNPTGYNALNIFRDARIYSKAFFHEGDRITLKKDLQNPNANEYLALGDNTTNSKDSRYWGPVRQYNVLGPAFLTLWPFFPHWGSIE